MLVSKYGFADLNQTTGMEVLGSKGADPARVAAQAVSGISFLCAGVIFKVGSSIKGLTTAAGIWMTAGIGLAVGAGMYVVVAFTAVLLWLLQYVFYRIPKALFTDEQYRTVSTDARVLYGLMLDRLALSERNGWCDEEGRLFIYFTLEDVEKCLSVSHGKALTLMRELEKVELIRKKRQGLGHPNRIYLGRFQRVQKMNFQK